MFALNWFGFGLCWLLPELGFVWIGFGLGCVWIVLVWVGFGLVWVCFGLGLIWFRLVWVDFGFGLNLVCVCFELCWV